MAHKWAVGTNTKIPKYIFKTKKNAIESGRRLFNGIFFIWKIENSLELKNGQSSDR